jgi:hypothetical protein
VEDFLCLKAKEIIKKARSIDAPSVKASPIDSPTHDNSILEEMAS